MNKQYLIGEAIKSELTVWIIQKLRHPYLLEPEML